MRRSDRFPRLAHLALLASLPILLSACGGDDPEATAGGAAESPGRQAPSQPASDAAPLEIVSATLCRAVDPVQRPIAPTEEFRAGDMLRISVRLRGRPRQGTLTVRWYWKDNQLLETTLDLARTKLRLSPDPDTYAGFYMKRDKPLLVGAGYRVDLLRGDEKVGSHPFRIVGPPGAIPSRLHESVLCRSVDDQTRPVDPIDTFGPGDAVHLACRIDLGIDSWVQALWTIDGRLANEATRSIKATGENEPGLAHDFSHRPEQGWPPGRHEVALEMDGEIVARHAFTVRAE